MVDINLSEANAWRSFDKWFEENVPTRQEKLHARVTQGLFNDGCHSAWIHRAYVIEALLDRIDELEAKEQNNG